MTHIGPAMQQPRRVITNRSTMNKILTIIALFIVSAISASATKPAATKKPAEEMTYAAISRTNPFEIVPAAGMEILGQLDEFSDDSSEMIEDLLSYAKKHIGTRYVRGGKTPKGFDCSGFTSYVFKQFGITLSTSSSAQALQGTKVQRDEIVAGDLLFFTGRSAKSKRVGHVGIVVDHDFETGEITFIHAATSGGIKIDRISAPYYKARFLQARRVIE